jgi:hypothetical protein
MLTGEGELSWRLASVLGLVEGYRGRAGTKGGASGCVGVLLGGQGRNTPALQAFLRSAAERATDDRVPTRERVSAVALLGYTDFAFAGKTLGQLLDSRYPPELQLQVVRAFERLGDARGGTLLLARENWSRYTPQVREAVLATLTAKPPLINVLFDAIKAGVRPRNLFRASDAVAQACRCDGASR